jgi:hypothetical protein
MVGHLKLGELVVKFNYHYVFSIKVESGPFPWLFRVGNTYMFANLFTLRRIGFVKFPANT